MNIKDLAEDNLPIITLATNNLDIDWGNKKWINEKINFIKEKKSEHREDFAPGNPVPTSTFLTIRIGGCCFS